MGERFPAPHPLLLWTPQALQSARGAALSLYPAEKSPRNPLFSEEHPWEARFDNLYANVLLEQGQYRCWYSPFLTDEASRTPVSKRRGMRYFSAGRRMGVCYAQSADGLNWVKPSLGLVDFEGSRANNIVLDGAHGAGILRDELEPDPSRRYKAIFSHDPDRGMSVAWSPVLIAEADLSVVGRRWQGLGSGHGHLQSRCLEVQAAGRRVGGRPRRARLHLTPAGRPAEHRHDP